jgi:hypothetical protein
MCGSFDPVMMSVSRKSQKSSQPSGSMIVRRVRVQLSQVETLYAGDNFEGGAYLWKNQVSTGCLMVQVAGIFLSEAKLADTPER